ncbi:MAG: hypothetical protein ACRC2T_18725 [Thermoguttaceae bacterium]
MKHLSILSALVFCTLISVGCGGNVKVKGKVSFPDGEPLSTGQVVFENEKVSAMGKLNEDGTYVLGSKKENDGLPTGKYRVYITGAVTYGEAPKEYTDMYGSRGNESPLPSSIPLVNRKFMSAETSGIEVDVKGAMTKDITVERP